MAFLLPVAIYGLFMLVDTVDELGRLIDARKKLLAEAEERIRLERERQNKLAEVDRNDQIIKDMHDQVDGLRRQIAQMKR